MPVDFSFLEPPGLYLHIKLNALLSEYGFFKGMPTEDKREFDRRVESLITPLLEYSDEAA